MRAQSVDPPAQHSRFVFITSNDAWGGSEELWSAAAAMLAAEGHTVAAWIGLIDPNLPRIRELRRLSCTIHQRSAALSLVHTWLATSARAILPSKTFKQLFKLLRPAVLALGNVDLSPALVRHRRPTLVVISQMDNFDGWPIARLCRLFKSSYVMIAHKASYQDWPPDSIYPEIRASFEDARWCYFVSEHNRRLTQEQIGFELPRSSIVRNPFLVPWARRNDWPDIDRGLRLACVGKLFPQQKGQDLLLRVLARDKWRARPLSVTFYGAGPQCGALKRMAAMLQVDCVSFVGFTEDVAAIWNDHHGLILPSRAEGLPLVIVEAMLSGRVPIITNTGGNGEVVTDGETGFLAAAPTEECLDDALERAWQQRDNWRAIGNAAADRIRTLVPVNPARVFADHLLQISRQAITKPAEGFPRRGFIDNT
jgi:glycosyltransferase involved in cell wall biosynthesis